jgi:magnesium-transporting ATPase (P-type)
VFSDKTGTLTCNQMKFRLLSVVAPGDVEATFSAHMYGSIHANASDGAVAAAGAAASGGAATGHTNAHKAVLLNDELDEKRELVFAAVAGGKMVRCVRLS